MELEPEADLRRRLERRLDELPVLPTVVARLLTLDREAETYFEDLLELVEADATFAARTLSAANSAASAPSDPVTTVRGALARLGSSGVRSLIMAMAVTRVFIPRDPWEASLWRHTLQVAAAARRLAAHDPDHTVDPDVAFATGLLHDIGRFVMFAEAPDMLRAVDEGDWDSPMELIEVERAVCGLTHSEIGSVACQTWGLPDSFERLVLRHHDPDVDLEATDPLTATLAVLRFADLAMFPSAMPGTPGLGAAEIDEIEAALSPKRPTWLPVTPRQLQEVVVVTIEETDAIAAELGFG